MNLNTAESAKRQAKATRRPERTEEEMRDVPQLRSQTIKDMLLDALNQPDAATAGLGIINSDLMSMAAQLKDAIEEACVCWSEPVERLRELLPALREYLRITGQIVAYSQLLHQIKAVRPSLNALPSRPK